MRFTDICHNGSPLCWSQRGIFGELTRGSDNENCKRSTDYWTRFFLTIDEMMRTRWLKTAPSVNNFSHWKVTVNIARSHSSISASESTVEPRLQLWYYIYINNHLLCLILNPCQIPISYLNEGWAATTLAEEAMETNCSFETEYWTRSFPTATVRLLVDYPGQAFS